MKAELDRGQGKWVAMDCKAPATSMVTMVALGVAIAMQAFSTAAMPELPAETAVMTAAKADLAAM
eukprot:6204860-Pleurochrysis_carterae.AAC.4